MPGTTANEPEPAAWEAVDPGAGEHRSKGAGLNDLAVELAAETGANAFAGTRPDASRNLLHFLGNSGEPLEQDVDKMLSDVPEFQEQVDRSVDQLIAEAVARAQEDGVTGPVTFPVSSDWRGFGYDENGALMYDNSNWFYALGGWQSSQTGTVTVSRRRNLVAVALHLLADRAHQGPVQLGRQQGGEHRSDSGVGRAAGRVAPQGSGPGVHRDRKHDITTHK